ncbi:antibiotic acetyltransferase [Aquibacillus halophilus]|uniref:Antibiotic acetyltransferase n=1 Tax=Aquibacillus halophilus TaxID=930132 RepID=A0A6A8DE86_9BACI|nr:DapH/DapD/GlmU-related protein [Aquibacillus halophilus]MRH41227.1 antibiotic acetyltransferase [Aquibacillus halophilus]
MWLKVAIKNVLLKYKKRIVVDSNSSVNYSVVNRSKNSTYPVKILNSICSFNSVNEGCKITDARCYGEISLGRFVSITGPGTILNSLEEGIQIGSFSSIGQNVCIVDFNHRIDRISSSFFNNKIFGQDVLNDIQTKGPVIIEEDVWVGSNTLILPGVTIGRGSVVGGGSVVTKSIPRYSIAYGNPAKVQSKRFNNDEINFLEELTWWEWSEEKFKKNQNLFNIDLKKVNIHSIEIKK